MRIVGEVENIGPGRHPRPRRAGRARAPTSRPASRAWSATGSGPRSRVTDSGALRIGPRATSPQQLEPTPRRRTSPTCRTRPPTLIAGDPARSPTRTRRATTTRPATSTPPTRVHWERIEPVAESFGDLDPLLDAREADLAEGDAWSGWHLIEKDLWPPAPEANGGDGLRAADDERSERPPRRTSSRTRSSSSTRSTRRTSRSRRSRSPTAPRSSSTRSRRGKVTGEEEIWSHTDLWDFQANVDGREAGVRGAARTSPRRETPSWSRRSTTRFDALERAARHARLARRRLQGVRRADRRPRSRRWPRRSTPLGEPLSRLTTTVTGAG